MAVDENVEIIEEEEVIDGEIRKVKKIIKTKVIQEIVVVEPESEPPSQNVTQELLVETKENMETITMEKETITMETETIAITTEENNVQLDLTTTEDENAEHVELVVEPEVENCATEEAVVTEESQEEPITFPVAEEEESPSSDEEPDYALLSLVDQLTCRYEAPSGRTDYCMVTDNRDGTYMVDINASETGSYIVDVELDGKRIPRAPFSVRIIQKTDSKKVLMYGEGLRSRVLGEFDSSFYVDTKGAGPGNLKVQIHGPKDGFSVTMNHNSQDKRLVRINYEPIESGIYTVNVMWSGEHIAGSPCRVCIAADAEFLEKWLCDPESVAV